jgi:hypothetical protein
MNGMSSRFDILLGKPAPEIVYYKPKIKKRVLGVFSNTTRSDAGEHKCELKETYVAQGDGGFICTCNKMWSFLNYCSLKEREEKIEILNKRKEQRIKKGFTKND